jgi:hypothetical protein
MSIAPPSRMPIPLGKTGGAGLGARRRRAITSATPRVTEAERIVARGDRRRRHVLRQLLGVPQRPQRRLAGPRAVDGRAARQGLLMTKVCTHGRDGTLAHEDARGVAAPASHRPPRRVADPRRRLRQRSGARLPQGRRPRGARPGQAPGQGRASSASPGTRGPTCTGDDHARLPVGHLPVSRSTRTTRLFSFEQRVLPECNKRGIAVLGMKPMTGKAGPSRKAFSRRRRCCATR